MRSNKSSYTTHHLCIGFQYIEIDCIDCIDIPVLRYLHEIVYITFSTNELAKRLMYCTCEEYSHKIFINTRLAIYNKLVLLV